MGRNRTMHGTLAAATAVVCVLGLAPPATGYGGGFCGLLLEQSRCCAPVGVADSIAPGVACPPAGTRTGGRVVALSGGPVPSPRPSLSGGEGALIGAPAEAPAPPGESAARARLAQKDADRQDTDRTEDASETAAPAESGTPSGGDASETFKGSPRPAGPDLTVTEERALISSGWK